VTASVVASGKVKAVLLAAGRGLQPALDVRVKVYSSLPP